ncbi:MAG: NAD(+) diphosphatase [Clostridia bacterium]|nr:NAD(+) diphosphatase [Clostridia bacterium]
MIQDIGPHRLYNQFDPAATPEDGDTVLLLSGGTVAAKLSEKTLAFPKVRDFAAEARARLIYLFRVDEERFFLCTGEDALPEGFAMTDLRTVRQAEPEPKYLVFAALTGKHLADWYRDTRFCGRCGTPTVPSEKERARICPACGNTAYPRIMPAVIAGVIDGDRILLTRYNRPGAYNALIAGFTEIGETLEETVAREVMEEAGLKVKNIRYYKSQPWGVANDILTGFFCDLDGSDEIVLDANELKSAVWTKREDIVLQPDRTSLTNEMMERFKSGEPC